MRRPLFYWVEPDWADDVALWRGPGRECVAYQAALDLIDPALWPVLVDALVAPAVGDRVVGYAGDTFGWLEGTLVETDPAVAAMDAESIRVDGQPTPYAIERASMRRAQRAGDAP